jgi:2'-5' RNA ligase
MLIGFAALLPDDVHNFMRAAALELHERFGTSGPSTTIEPHVTFKQPFEGDVPAAASYLDALAASTERFELVLADYATFEGEGVLFLDVVEGAGHLVALQRRLLDELGVEPGAYESGGSGPYHAHATLAVGLNAHQLAEARAMLPPVPHFRFTVERLGLFARVEAGWLVYRRAGLG